MNVLGKRIEKERIGCGLTREELAQQLHVKTEELISWEEGHSYPNFYICQKLVKMLNIPLQIVSEDTMYRKVLYHMEPVLSSSQLKWRQILGFCALAVIQCILSFSMLEIAEILSLVELTVILFYIVGIVLTVNNKMRPYSTGWFVGVPFLYSGSFLAMILMAKYPLFVMISIVIAIIFAVGMIAVFYLEISKFCYYATLTICFVIIVGGIVLMFLAARSMVLTVVFSSGRASLLMALFSLQLRVYYRKRDWLKNDHVKDGDKDE